MTLKSYDWDLRNIAKISPTSRERHKSAPYPRPKRASKCPVFFYSTRKTRKLHPIGMLKGETFWNFQYFCCKTSKKMKGPFEDIKIFSKSLTTPKRTERRYPFVSSGIVCYAKKRKNLFSSVLWAKCFGQLFWSVCVDQKKESLK